MGDQQGVNLVARRSYVSGEESDSESLIPPGPPPPLKEAGENLEQGEEPRPAESSESDGGNEGAERGRRERKGSKMRRKRHRSGDSEGEPRSRPRSMSGARVLPPFDGNARPSMQGWHLFSQVSELMRGLHVPYGHYYPMRMTMHPRQGGFDDPARVIIGTFLGNHFYELEGEIQGWHIRENSGDEIQSMIQGMVLANEQLGQPLGPYREAPRRRHHR